MNQISPTILAFDASSTHIGYVIYHAAVIEHGEWTMAGPIEVRCRIAYNRFWLLLDRIIQPDMIAIEAPVCRFAKAVIPQARVSGALMVLAGQRDIPVVEISPTAAKLALAGKGTASKDVMMTRAGAYGVIGEHAADSLGVALAASKLGVRMEAVS
jgi:Holliday junction resolvasome RuvABC endonuclease subunit